MFLGNLQMVGNRLNLASLGKWT